MPDVQDDQHDDYNSDNTFSFVETTDLFVKGQSLTKKATQSMSKNEAVINKLINSMVTKSKVHEAQFNNIEDRINS